MLWLTRALTVKDVVVGQYNSHVCGSVKYLGYTEDRTVPYNSVTPIFDVAVLVINDACWDGVPFLMKANKALHTKRVDDFLSQITKYVSSDNQIEFGNSVDSYQYKKDVHCLYCFRCNTFNWFQQMCHYSYWFGLVTATHECILLAKYCQYIIVQRKPTIWCDLGATPRLV